MVQSIAGSISDALAFINGILNFFACESEPKCPESKEYRFHDGSQGQAQGDVPNITNVADSVPETPTPPPPIPVPESFALPRLDGIYNPSSGSVIPDVNTVTSGGTLSKTNSESSQTNSSNSKVERNVLELY